MKPFFVSTVLLLLSLTMGQSQVWAAVSDRPPAQVSICALDLSGSMGVEQRLSSLVRTLQAAQKDELIYVIGFARNSVELLKVRMPSEHGPRDINLKQARQAIIETLRTRLRERGGNLDRSSTDVLGVLQQASRIFEESGAATKRLYIFSDHIETTGFKMDLGVLTKPNEHQQLLTEAARRGVHLPRLDGVAVYASVPLLQGQKMTTTQRETGRREIKAFWEDLYRQSGAQLAAWRSVD